MARHVQKHAVAVRFGQLALAIEASRVPTLRYDLAACFSHLISMPAS